VRVTPSRLVRLIHKAPLRIVLATTGGGASALSQLLAVPGASRTILQGLVPYSAAALRQFLGATPEHYCSSETSRAMAMASFQRALALAQEAAGPDWRPADAVALAGVACTASLATDRKKQGPHRAHLAVQTAAATATQSIEFEKGRRSRRAEENLLGSILLNLVAQAAGVAERLTLTLLPSEALTSLATDAPPPWQQLLLGDLPAARHGPDVAAAGRRRAIFPGAFNPRHQGHRALAEVAQRRLAAPIEHEIAMLNVDKPPLDYTEMRRRLDQFSPDETVWFTRAPRFEQKADIFPQSTFLVGVDTVIRIADPRYYGDETLFRDRALRHLAERGSRFLVFGRVVDKSFVTLADLQLPEALKALCEEIPQSEFRADISSTELRQEGVGDAGPRDSETR